MKRRLGVLLIAASLVMFASVAQAVTQPQYIISCAYTGQTEQIDPIVSPGMTSAHLHDFIGAPNITSTTVPADLVGKQTTSCNNQNGFMKPDGSAAWVPVLYYNGQPVHPVDFHFYYRCTNPASFCGQVLPLPTGTEFVAGNPHATTDQSLGIVKWNCGANNTGTTPHTTKPHDCSQYYPGSGGVDGLTATILFPMCWSGSLPAGNDTAEFAYPVRGRCPAGFGTPVERVEEHIHYGIWDATTTNITLSSGPYYTMHGDYMDGWTENAHSQIVTTCLNSGGTCS